MVPPARLSALEAGKKAAASQPAAQRTTGGGGFVKADWKEGFKKKQVGVSDMTLLSTISNESINDNLKKRFENAEIYTYIGHVLISVNPFRLLPIYGDDVLHSYRGKNRLEVPPHVYAIAESAYYNMISYKENQCVIISGESGAGKTEAAKRIMQYIAAVAGEHSGAGAGIEGVKEMVLATNPLLESFGCAKTLRNNNSSRHVSRGWGGSRRLGVLRVVGRARRRRNHQLPPREGAHLLPPLHTLSNLSSPILQNRVTGQIDSERNFHIFYQLTKGASAAQRDAYGLQGPEAYAYTSRSNCLQVPGIDDIQDWAETLQAMRVIGITDGEQDDIFRNLATILWLGNVEFGEMEDGNAFVKDESVPSFVAYLMEVEASLVTKVLTSRVVETQRGGKRGSVYEVPLNPAQASSVRDALAKAIYSNLFDWIVARVNVSMKARAETAHIIGVLDIYGFEIFDTNQFEQLCINYVNEKLQQIFIQLTLKTEQEEYVREQIKWTPIDYFNNKVVCDLIEEKRPPGIFAALNDACATAHADPTAADGSFSQRLGGVSSPQFESRGSKFLIRHYAGDVMYTVAGMTDKNKDVLLKDLLDLVGSSSNQFLQGLFPDRPDPNSKKRPPTAGDKIKSSANALVEKLMRSQPSYIRTIKPNQNKSPTEYDSKAILHQIKYLGLQENIRVRRAGFAYRNTFEKMVERFYLLSPSTSYAGEYTWQGDAKTGCERILRDTGIAKEEWQMGTTKAFIKNPETLFALEHMRDRYWHNMAGRIQRAFRNYIRYKHECATRIQRFWMSKKDAIVYAQVRDYGHQILASRKERRRFSLLSMRKFMGDYLGVGENGPQGTMLKNAAGIGGGETVAFSARASLLVSKLGRSSKPSPRYLILTDKAVYILISQVVSGRAQTTTERKIPLVTIKSVGLSTLRDDWMAINVSNSEEADPVMSCYFKTEFVTHLLQRTNGGVTVKVAPAIEYAKKKDKMAQITFKKDESVRKDDVYKSHAVSVCSGEPATSLSMPPARRKPGVVRPVASGKLLRAGGPSQTSNKPRPVAQKLPGSGGMGAAAPALRPTPAPPGGAGRAPAAPLSNGANRAAPPPPSRAAAPPPPPEPQVDMYKAYVSPTPGLGNQHTSAPRQEKPPNKIQTKTSHPFKASPTTPKRKGDPFLDRLAAQLQHTLCTYQARSKVNPLIPAPDASVQTTGGEGLVFRTPLPKKRRSASALEGEASAHIYSRQRISTPPPPRSYTPSPSAFADTNVAPSSKRENLTPRQLKYRGAHCRQQQYREAYQVFPPALAGAGPPSQPFLHPSPPSSITSNFPAGIYPPFVAYAPSNLPPLHLLPPSPITPSVQPPQVPALQLLLAPVVAALPANTIINHPSPPIIGTNAITSPHPALTSTSNSQALTLSSPTPAVTAPTVAPIAALGQKPRHKNPLRFTSLSPLGKSEPSQNVQLPTSIHTLPLASTSNLQAQAQSLPRIAVPTPAVAPIGGLNQQPPPYQTISPNSSFQPIPTSRSSLQTSSSVPIWQRPLPFQPSTSSPTSSANFRAQPQSRPSPIASTSSAPIIGGVWQQAATPRAQTVPSQSSSVLSEKAKGKRPEVIPDRPVSNFSPKKPSPLKKTSPSLDVAPALPPATLAVAFRGPPTPLPPQHPPAPSAQLPASPFPPLTFSSLGALAPPPTNTPLSITNSPASSAPPSALDESISSAWNDLEAEDTEWPTIPTVPTMPTPAEHLAVRNQAAMTSGGQMAAAAGRKLKEEMDPEAQQDREREQRQLNSTRGEDFSTDEDAEGQTDEEREDEECQALLVPPKQ
ncbi:myosin I, partial [Phenoliferia sp. Uapishka_3]